MNWWRRDMLGEFVYNLLIIVSFLVLIFLSSLKFFFFVGFHVSIWTMMSPLWKYLKQKNLKRNNRMGRDGGLLEKKWKMNEMGKVRSTNLVDFEKFPDLVKELRLFCLWFPSSVYLVVLAYLQKWNWKNMRKLRTKWF